MFLHPASFTLEMEEARVLHRRWGKASGKKYKSAFTILLLISEYIDLERTKVYSGNGEKIWYVDVFTLHSDIEVGLSSCLAFS
jgi:hypothetical protein